MSNPVQPSIIVRVVHRLVGRLVPPCQREYLLGDLEEALVERRTAGKLRTSLWWAGQLVDVLVSSPRWHWELRMHTRRRDRRPRTLGASRVVAVESEQAMQGILNDLKFVLRQLSRSPGFVLASVLILGLGLGANLTIFSLANAILLRPIPGVSPAAEHFKVLSRTEQDRDFEASLSYPDFLAIEQAFDDLAVVAARDEMPVALRIGDVTERRRGAVVSGKYFDVLGVTPLLGRNISPRDDQAVLGSPVAVISHRLWRDRLGSSSDVLGQELTINGSSFEIVGVAPAGFKGDDRFQYLDVWVPITMQPVARPSGADLLNERESTWLDVLGRRGEDVPLARFAAIVDSLERDFSIYEAGDTRRREFAIDPGLGLDPSDRRAARALAGVLLLLVSLVLGIACANVANLVLARSSRRISEISLRRALGAGQRRIVRLLLTESVVVAFLAMAAGLVAAVFLRRILLGLLPSMILETGIDLSFDGRVLAYALVLALGSAVLFGLAPAVNTSGAKPGRSLVGPSSTRRGGRLRGGLVVAQLALSVMLLMGSGLLLETMRRLQTVALGFEPAGRISAAVDLSLTGKKREEMESFFARLLEDLNQAPGVHSAAFATTVPLSGSSDSYGGLTIEGNDPPPGRPGWTAQVNNVSPGFFETLSIPLASGRDFTSSDDASSPPVAIVNREFQQRFWPDASALGKTISRRRGDETEVIRVIGLANDVPYRSLGTAPEPMMYFPLTQRPEKRVAILVRGVAEGGVSLPPNVLEQAVARLDRDVPVYAVAPLAQVVQGSLWETRMISSLLSMFGALALTLATVGLYGVISCLVSERRKEIGIRLALGAKPFTVASGLFQRSLRLSGLAISLGLLGSLGLGQLLSGFLYGVSALDLRLMFVVTFLLLLVSVVASLGPLTAAARLQPSTVLRADG